MCVQENMWKSATSFFFDFQRIIEFIKNKLTTSVMDAQRYRRTLEKLANHARLDVCFGSCGHGGTSLKSTK